MTPRHFSLLAAAGLAALGLAAGGASLAAGLFDQAVAFVWPSLGGAVALALFAPDDARDQGLARLKSSQRKLGPRRAQDAGL